MKETLQIWFDGLKVEIQDNLASTGTNTTKKTTSNSLRVDVTETNGILYGAKWFKVVEHGHDGKGVPVNFREIIKQWILDKPISFQAIAYKRQASANWQPKYTPEERGLNQLSYLISEKIKKNGTRLYQDGGRQDIYTEAIDKKLPELKKMLKFDIVKKLQ